MNLRSPTRRREGRRAGVHGARTFELVDGTTVARVRPAAGDPDVALLHVFAAGRAPSAEVLQRWFAAVRDAGYRGLRTGATARADWPMYERLDLRVAQELVVLQHPLTPIERSRLHRDYRLARLRNRDLAGAAAIDASAFVHPWAMDVAAIREAREATPNHRSTLVRSGGSIVAYAVTGHYGLAGYLQRLAVHPDHRHRGIARQLVADSLRWSRRAGAVHALVNTQIDNHPALALYRSMGYVDTDAPLKLFELRFDDAPTQGGA